MTLARGNIRGYEDDRMVLLFSMMDGDREVRCAVSASAMDDLEHVPRTPANQREEQFVRLRDRIEACASRKFLAREFEGSPRVLVVASPTRGLDVAAIETVHHYLRQAAEGYVGVLLISEDLDEILALADRVAVMYEGAIVGERDASSATVEELGLLMAGATE